MTQWSVALQATLSLGFPREEYWSGLPLLSPGDCPDPGIEPTSPALASGFFITEPPGKAQFIAHLSLQPQPNSALNKRPHWSISLVQCNHQHSRLFTTLGAFITITQCLFYPKDCLSCEEQPIWVHSYIAVPGMQWCSSEYLLNMWTLINRGIQVKMW